MWSPISLPAILELGKDFKEFCLKGGQKQIISFSMIMSIKILLRLFHLVIFGIAILMHKETRVLLTYSWKMRFFNDYAQQLEMESIGKQPNKNSILQKTGQIVFGGFGSTAQH
jgi:glucose-6-phosphate isomerase